MLEGGGQRGSEREKWRPAIKLTAFQKEAHVRLGQKLDSVFLLSKGEAFYPSKGTF